MINLLHTMYRRVNERRARQGSVRPGRDVFAAECDGLVVLLDLRREAYFGLDEVGSLIWQEVENGGDCSAAARRICAEYDAAEDIALADAERLIAQLSDLGLVVHA